MTPEQKFLVRQSFVQILPLADTVAELFYQRLFDLDPSLRGMFKGNMKTQGRKLMATLKMAIHFLDRLDELIPVLQTLGQRHVGYGVTDAHYDTVAEALLWSLAWGLRDDFRPEVKDAWVEAYTLMAEVMKQAAHQVEDRAPTLHPNLQTYTLAEQNYPVF